MSDTPTPIHERLAVISEADDIFKQGVDADIAGNISGHCPREFWEEAVHLFNAAAVKYRDLGLGLKAREAWSRSTECHRQIASEHMRCAWHCEDGRESIEVLWEGESRE